MHTHLTRACLLDACRAQAQPSNLGAWQAQNHPTGRQHAAPVTTVELRYAAPSSEWPGRNASQLCWWGTDTAPSHHTLHTVLACSNHTHAGSHWHLRPSQCLLQCSCRPLLWPDLLTTRALKRTFELLKAYKTYARRAEKRDQGG